MNPIVIGLALGVLTYIYLMWKANLKKDKKKSEVSLKIPVIVAIVGMIIAYVVCSSDGSNSGTNNGVNNVVVNQPKLLNNLTSESPTSYHIISKGVNIPNNIKIPDVFIETTY